MDVTSQFGIVTGCHAGDYFMAKATCASIRHFLGAVPICLVVDGDFSVAELQQTYGVIPFYVRDLQHPDLRRLCPRSGRVKLAALWEGPFERFLWMDCDAVIWGNILAAHNLTDVDFVVMRPSP